MNALSPTTILALAPVGATALLLAATHRAWLCRRGWVESVAFVVVLGAFAPALAALPPVVFRATATFAAFGSFWLGAAMAAWRFAPDFGQSGAGWAWRITMRPAFHAGLGLALAHAALAAAAVLPFLHLVLLAFAALASRQAVRALSFINHPVAP